MWSKRRRGVLFAVIVISAAAAIASGAASAEADSPPTRFLVKAGEMSGFVPGKAQVFRTVSAIRNGSGEGASPRLARRLEAEGFAEAAFVKLRSRAERSAAAVSSVIEFEGPAGAEAEMEAEVKEGFGPSALDKEARASFLRTLFKVPGVPGGVGVTFLTSDAVAKRGYEFGIAAALFVEESCLISVDVVRLKSREVAKPVSEALRDVFRRTAGTCPAAEAPAPGL